MKKHNIGVIGSYNGETITTDYISTTGSLSTGAFVQYVLNDPNYIECTQEQIEALESIIRAYTYDITNINSTDETSLFEMLHIINNYRKEIKWELKISELSRRLWYVLKIWTELIVQNGETKK